MQVDGDNRFCCLHFYCRDMIMVIKFYEYNIFIMMTFECHNQFDS